MKRRTLFLLLLLPVAALARPVESPLPLTVAYLERPPYYYTQHGRPAGFLLDLTRDILTRAGITATFVALPPKRIVEELRRNTTPFCAIGWFKTAERQQFARFSQPIYRDQSTVILTSTAKAEAIQKHHSLIEVFQDRSLVLAQLEAFSYGPYVDSLLQATKVSRLTVPSTQSVLPRLIDQGRAAYMLIAPEEIPSLLREAGLDPARFQALSMPDIPLGNARHLMFNTNLPDSMLERIDAAIRDLVGESGLPARGAH